MRAISHPRFTFHDTRVTDAFGGFKDFNDAAHIGCANSDALLRFILSTAAAGGAVQASSDAADYERWLSA